MTLVSNSFNMSLEASAGSKMKIQSGNFYKYGFWSSEIEFVKCNFRKRLVSTQRARFRRQRSAIDSKASWSLISSSICSNMSSATYDSSIWPFYRSNLLFFLLCADCFCFDFKLWSVTRFLCENNWKWPTFENRILQNCHFLMIFFMDLKKLEQFWKLDSLRIQNLCMTWYFIPSASSASSWKIWQFC